MSRLMQSSQIVKMNSLTEINKVKVCYNCITTEKLKTKLLFELFDSLVGSILEYSSKVWL